MFRRLFWFVSGVIAGITGMAWVKRRAAEMREAITFESVMALVKDVVVASYQRVVLALARNGLFIGAHRDIDGTENTSRPPARPARRHIASRPHNSHR